MKMIVFQLHGEEYGLAATDVQSIERMLPITRVPGVQHDIVGVMNLRGVIIPVIDLNVRFGLQSTPFDKDTRILIIAREQGNIGLIVHGANNILDIADIKPVPEVSGDTRFQYFLGVVKIEDRIFTLLDVDKVLEA